MCGRSACTVRREGGLKTSPPYPYLKGTSSWTDWPELWRPRTLANAAADTPCAGRFPVIRRVPRGDQFRPLRGRWHRNPFLPRAAERFGTAVLRDEKGLESGGIRRHKFWATCILRSDNLIAARTPQEPCFGSIPNMAKWHKRPEKAATLCHFLPVISAVETAPDLPKRGHDFRWLVIPRTGRSLKEP